MPAPVGVTIWDVETGQLLRTLGEADLIAASPDGAMLASAQVGAITLWVVQTTEPLRIERERTEGGLAFSRDGAKVATGKGKTITLWDVQSGELLLSFVGNNREVNYLDFSPDGALLASATSDNTVTIWDLQSGQAAQTLKGHAGLINSLAFSPDGALLASGVLDGTIILWGPTPQ
jgi:WD40 repeat protein